MEKALQSNRYLYTKSFLKLILSISVFLFPYICDAADVDLEKNLQKGLSRSKALVQTIKEKLQSGSPVSNDLSALKTLSDDIKASHLLLQERFKLRGQKVDSLGANAIERQRAMAEGYRKALEEYLSLLESVPAASGQESTARTQEKIEKLKSLLDKMLPQKNRPIIGSLPYKHLNYPSQEPSTASPITPAYKGGNITVSDDDTKSTPEAPISTEIATLAQTLNWNPVSIYEYVKNNIETEWYWGCMKGAAETLHQKSGNDCDQATLLTALLRASGFPTRYVRGTMEFFPNIDKAKNLIGVNDPQKIAEFFQKAGIPDKVVIAGGKVANIQIEHIWVETQIPYANYRGIIIDAQGKTWLGLDTSIKVKDYVYNSPQDLFEQSVISSQVSGIRDEYLSAVQTATPLEYLYGKLTAMSHQPSDYLLTRTLSEEHMKILPGSMQIEQVKVTNEYAQLPDELIHQVRFTATRNSQPAAGDNELFAITLPLYRLSNQRITMSYEPESVEDQETIDSYGGLDNTPAYLVRLRPVLKLNGERMIVSQDGLPMGADYNLNIEFRVPGFELTTEKMTNAQIVGNLSVIGLVAQKATPPINLQPETQNAEQLLYQEAINYIDRWNKAEDELASLLHLAITRPLPTVVTIGGVIDVTYLLDTPHGFTWKGVYVDADLRAIETVDSRQQTVGSQNAEGRRKTFMQLSSLQGSVLENRLMEDDYQAESISTAKLIQIVNQGSGGQDQGSGLLTIDKTNIDAVLPTLSADDNIKDDITNEVNQNLTIRIPQSEITYHDWTGIGYIKENLDTGESGWMLSGMIAGSYTVDDTWLNNMYFNAPFAGTKNMDPLSAAQIRKIPATDKQPAQTVGTSLNNPLSVMVLDRKNQPVVGAIVTFTIDGGGGKLACLLPPVPSSATDDECKAKTNQFGIAKASLTLGKHAGDNPYFDKLNSNDQFYTQLGLNLVTASVTGNSGTITIVQPFEAYGKPDVPVDIFKVLGDGYGAIVNNPAGSLKVLVRDQYENPVSNVNVTFNSTNATSMNPESVFPTPDQGLRKLVLYKPDECTLSFPLYGECTTYETVSVMTSSYGALVDTIMGNTVQTKYTVEVSAPNLPAGPNLPVVKPVEFTLHSYGYRDGVDYIPTSVRLHYLAIINDKGQPINASKAGTPLKAPLVARFVKLTDTLIMVPESSSWRTTSNGVVNYDLIPNGNVTFKAKTGGGTAGATQYLSNGLYGAQYTTGSTPMKNTVEVSGIVTLQVPQIIVDRLGYPMQHGYSTNRLPIRTVNIPTGTYATFDSSTGELSSYMIEENPLYTVYGIGTKLTITPKYIQVDEQGFTIVDTTFTYTILPDGTGSTDPEAAYHANSADIDFYKADATNTDTWTGYMIGDSLQGQGTDILTEGTNFDVNVKNTAQVVLNRGNDAEVQSEKVSLKFINVQVTSPIMPGTEDEPNTSPVMVRVYSSGDDASAIQSLSIKTDVEMQSGGHSHESETTKRSITCPPRIKTPTGTWSQESALTLSNNSVSTTFKPSMGASNTKRGIAGKYKIIVSDQGNEIAKKDIVVKYDLTQLTAGTNYYLRAADTNHNNGDYHYGTTDANQAVQDAATEFVSSYGKNYKPQRNMVVNDQSLIWGGLFDIDGNWDADHKRHRDGRNVDIPYKYYDGGEVIVSIDSIPWTRLQAALVSKFGATNVRPENTKNHFHCIK